MAKRSTNKRSKATKKSKKPTKTTMRAKPARKAIRRKAMPQMGKKTAKLAVAPRKRSAGEGRLTAAQHRTSSPKSAKSRAARAREEPVAATEMSREISPAPPTGAPIPPELLHQGHRGFDGPVVHEHTKPPDVRATIRAQQHGRRFH